MAASYEQYNTHGVKEQLKLIATKAGKFAKHQISGTVVQSAGLRWRGSDFRINNLSFQNMLW